MLVVVYNNKRLPAVRARVRAEVRVRRLNFKSVLKRGLVLPCYWSVQNKANKIGVLCDNLEYALSLCSPLIAKWKYRSWKARENWNWVKRIFAVVKQLADYKQSWPFLTNECLRSATLSKALKKCRKLVEWKLPDFHATFPLFLKQSGRVEAL